MNIPILPRLLILAALLPLAGCTQSAAPQPAAAMAPVPAKPAAPLPPAPGATVTVSEEEAGPKGKTVRIGPGEVVAFRLGINESTGNRWFLSNRLAGGVLAKKGNATYAQTPAGTVATVLYQGLHVGTQELLFTYAPPDARQNVARTANFRVIVR